MDITSTREYQDLVRFYTDSGMSQSDAERNARIEIEEALS